MRGTDGEFENLVIKIVFGSILGIVGLILVFGSFYTIESSERGVLQTFGEIDMTAKGEGLHFKVPIIQKITKMSVRTLKYEADLSAASKDLQDVNTKIAINYRIDSTKVPEIYKNLGLDYAGVMIQPLEQETNKAITAQFTAEELITKRDEVRQKMKEALVEKLASKNIIVEEISIVNFAFSPSFTQAIEAKVTAEQNALREQNNLKVIEFQAQQKVAQAKGEAEAIEIINMQLLKSPQYIDYMTIQKWDGIMPLALGSGTLLSITN